MVSLLPGGVPNFKLDGGVVQANGLGQESGAFKKLRQSNKLTVDGS